MADVEGIVTEALEAACAGTDEVGLQVSVCRDGELIVDVAWGVADRDTGRPVDSATLFPVFSVTKGVVSTAVLHAVDDKVLDLDEPVAEHWPAFARNGKQNVRVRDVLTHSAGIPAMPEGCTPEQMCDWAGMVAAVEAMEPLWEPGTATGYHAYTYGWIAGELLRRARGAADPLELFAAELAGLGVADFWIGLPGTERARVATLHHSGVFKPGATALFDRTLPGAVRPQPAVFNRADVQRSCHPAAGGIGTAASLARFYDAVGAEARGWSTAVSAAVLPQTEASDLVLGRPIRKGLGYFLAGDNPQTVPWGPGDAFGHPGSGGSTAWADPSLGVGIAITKNWMAGPAEPSILAVADAARRAAAVSRTSSQKVTSP